MWNENSGISKEVNPCDKKIIFPISDNKKGSEKNQNLLLLQCFICAAIFLVCFLISSVSPTAKSDIKKYVYTIINDGSFLSGEDEIARLAQSVTDTVKKFSTNLQNGETASLQAAQNDNLNNNTENEEINYTVPENSQITDILSQNSITNDYGELNALQSEDNDKNYDASETTNESQNTSAQGQGGFAYKITNLDQISADATLQSYTLSETPFTPLNGFRLTSGFGFRKSPINAENEFHTGVDLAAAENSGVYSAFYGIVIEAGYDEIRGNYICIKHSSSLTTLYSHLNYIFVSVGDIVNKGAVIGSVGSTGMSTGPHLHFEIKINGMYVNPENSLDIPVYDKL